MIDQEALKIHKRNNITWYSLITILLFFVNCYNIFYILIFNYTNSKILLIILPAFKDFFLIIIFSFSFLLMIINLKSKLEKSLIPIYFFILLWILIVLIYTILSPAPTSYLIYNFRQSLLLIIAFILFSSLNFDFREDQINRILALVCYIVIVFGFIEYALPDLFWNDLIGLKKYSQNRFLGGTQIERNYSSDLIFLIERRVRRMMSFFAEPVTFGSFVTFFFHISCFPKKVFLRGGFY